MDFNTAGAGKTEEATNALKAGGETGSSPVGDENKKEPIKTAQQESDEELDAPFTYNRTVSIALIQNYSLYRKANDKVLPKRRDFIGSSVRSSQVLASNRAEVEAYFPQLLGLSPNNENFISRLKQYLNNIQVRVDELGVTFDCSFQFNHKRDYLKFKTQEEAIELQYKKANRQNIQELRKALDAKIMAINNLESQLHAYGSPVNIAENLLNRHS